MKWFAWALALALIVTPSVAKDLSEWSTTAGSNNDASPDGWPEQMAPSGVNDSARENMAAIRRWYDSVYAHNFLINGGFQIAQRGTTFAASDNNDDVYTLDRWVLLSDGNDAADVTQETSTVPTDAYAAIRLDVETVNKKFGILQIIENRDAAPIIAGTVSLRFDARITGSSIGEVRAGVMCWDSTADTVTSDVVSAWNAAGSNPTLVANWTFENTPANLSDLTTSYQTYLIETISLDTASCANVGVFIWMDDVTTSAGDFLYIANVQLQAGEDATVFEQRFFDTELQLAQRLYERRTYDSASNEHISTGNTRSTTAGDANLFYQEKRIAPSMTFTDGATFDWVDDTGNERTVSSLTCPEAGKYGCKIEVVIAADAVAGGGSIRRDATDTTFIEIDAEL